MDVATYIRKQLKKARLGRGLSQEALAEAFGSTQSTISGIERGRVDVSAADLFGLASVLGYPVSFFFPSAEGELTESESQLLHMLRQLPEDVRQANLASVASLYDLYRQAPEISALPDGDRQDAAIEAFAQYLLTQDVQVKLDESGFWVIDGGELSAFVETEGEKEQEAIQKALKRLAELQRGLKSKPTTGRNTPRADMHT